MSDPTVPPGPSGSPPDDELLPTDSYVRQVPAHLPGCGMAAFVGLLAAYFCFGFTTHSVSVYSVLQGAKQLSARNLTYGGNVDPRTLAPLRDAGAVGQDEVPDAYHAETDDGTRACAIVGRALVRLEEGVVTRLPLDTVTRVETTPESVVVHGTTTSLTCWFAAGEGAERLARMVSPR